MILLARKGGMNMANLRYKTPTDIRRTMGRVMNMVYNGELDPKRANSIILACNSILGAIRTDDQQKRIEELEMKIIEYERGGR